MPPRARLARIDGQLRGLQSMIEQGDQSPEHVAAMLTKFA
jgi:DNA-binding FrmR family transcriptional regulator